MSQAIDSFICGVHGVTRRASKCAQEASGKCRSPLDNPEVWEALKGHPRP
jgi:hypothetical protein